MLLRLDHVKKRIIEYLSVIKIKGDLKAPIICLVGPVSVCVWGGEQAIQCTEQCLIFYNSLVLVKHPLAVPLQRHYPENSTEFRLEV